MLMDAARYSERDRLATIAAERERCAKAVESLYFAPSSVGGDLILCGDTLDAAAAAIRKAE